MAIVDRTSPVPLYYQLKQILMEKIQGEQWHAGEMIPSEQELQDTYGLSRTTVRQTLTEMVFEGLLTRQRGRGTFVSPSKLTHNPDKRMRLSQSMLQQGLQPGWHVLETAWVTPNPKVQAELGVTAKVYQIKRLRLADEEPIGHHIAYVPEAVARYIQEDTLKVGESSQYLQNAPQMKDSYARRSIEALAANEIDASLLSIDENAPILQIERVTFAADGMPIEFMKARYRGDRFKYQIGETQ
jgi:GntR family transcriptional regulator